jgi:hypothetical protein|tara:strand:- start:52 stop:201 length:150 start_codon:yes stop_codon:yes gene_type:complete
MSKKLLLILVSFMIGGCEGVPLTPEGRMVWQIQSDWKNKCQFLGSDSID